MIYALEGIPDLAEHLPPQFVVAQVGRIFLPHLKFVGVGVVVIGIDNRLWRWFFQHTRAAFRHFQQQLRRLVWRQFPVEIDVQFPGDRTLGAEAPHVFLPHHAVWQRYQCAVNMAQACAQQGEGNYPAVYVIAEFEVIAFFKRAVDPQHYSRKEVLEGFLGGQADNGR